MKEMPIPSVLGLLSGAVNWMLVRFAPMQLVIVTCLLGGFKKFKRSSVMFPHKLKLIACPSRKTH